MEEDKDVLLLQLDLVNAYHQVDRIETMLSKKLGNIFPKC